MNQNLSDAGRAGGRVRWAVWSALAGLALGAALVWAGVLANDRDQAADIDRLQDSLRQAQVESDSLHAQRDVLEGQLLVERSTRKGLETTLDVVQDELGSARDQIAFFNELLPPGPEGSISIRGLDFQQKGSILNYRVLLMRNGAGTKPFDGMLQFQANGRVAGDPVTVILEPVRAPAPDIAFNEAAMGILPAAGSSDVSALSGAGVEEGPDVRADDAAGGHAVINEGTREADNESTLDADHENARDGDNPRNDGPVQGGNDVDEPPSNSILSLTFDQFQRSSGVLQIPEGVELEDVTLNVFEGQTLRLSRTVDLPAQQLQH